MYHVENLIQSPEFYIVILDEKICDENARCFNYAGNYSCECNSFYLGDGKNCTPTEILLLSKKPYPESDNLSPVLFNVLNEKREVDCFVKDVDTVQTMTMAIQGSCSVSWENKMHFIGGFLNLIQPNPAGKIHRLDGFKITKVGELSDSMQNCACSVMGSSKSTCL